MTTQPKKIEHCEVCGNRQLVTVLDLGSHPMCDDLVPVGEDRVCKEYPIVIGYCKTCCTAHQLYQVPKQELFPRTYHYRSRFTADVLNGMRQLVASCEERFGALAGKRVLDIGCNDGSLLSFFQERGAKTIGIEPTDASLDARARGHAVYDNFLSEALAAQVVAEHGSPDIIVFTNVFAHIEDLGEVIRSLKRLASKDTAIVIENHYLGSVLDGNQFDTFYHEHPRTYSCTSFVHVAKSLGMALSGVEFPSRYGGNIRVFLSAASNHADADEKLANILQTEQGYFERFARMTSDMRRWCERKRQFIAALVDKHGPIRAKAFPGRAAILVKLLGIDEKSVLAVHEKPGSMKIGHYLPGTRIPIVSDDELFGAPATGAPLLNLAWHIPQEIRSYLAAHQYAGDVVDIIAAGDFEVSSS